MCYFFSFALILQSSFSNVNNLTVHICKCMSVCRVLNDMNNNTRTKKEKTGEISVVLLRICQFNTGDEHDEQAGSNEYSINKRTKEQHSAKFCLSHKPSMKDTKKKKKERRQ